MDFDSVNYNLNCNVTHGSLDVVNYNCYINQDSNNNEYQPFYPSDNEFSEFNNLYYNCCTGEPYDYSNGITCPSSAFSNTSFSNQLEFSVNPTLNNPILNINTNNVNNVDMNFSEVSMSPPETPINIATFSQKSTSQNKTHISKDSNRLVKNKFICQEYNYNKNDNQPKRRGRKPKQNVPEFFICEFTNCCKTFRRYEHLKRHIRSVHTLEKPYFCPIKNCNKRFSRSDNLSQHYKIHKRKICNNSNNNNVMEFGYYNPNNNYY